VRKNNCFLSFIHKDKFIKTAEFYIGHYVKIWIKFVRKMRFRRWKKSKLKEKEEDKGIIVLC
jgi:TATA-binding protein-associated factor Taf7